MQQYLTCSRGKIHETIWGGGGGATFGSKEPKSARNEVFCHFLNFRSLVFLEIAYNDSLQQCVTSSRGKIHEKSFGDQIWAKIVPKLDFLPFSQLWFISFP